eukprot:30551-Pelagococcus_subviridis.AAC.1
MGTSVPERVEDEEPPLPIRAHVAAPLEEVPLRQHRDVAAEAVAPRVRPPRVRRARRGSAVVVALAAVVVVVAAEEFEPALSRVPPPVARVYYYVSRPVETRTSSADRPRDHLALDRRGFARARVRVRVHGVAHHRGHDARAVARHRKRIRVRRRLRARLSRHPRVVLRHRGRELRRLRRRLALVLVAAPQHLLAERLELA